MTRRSARAGQIIKLRALFKDDLGDNAEASNVYVHLYEPDVTELELANAYTVSGVASYLGEGIFEYQFTIPSDGPDGNWTDVWEGTLTGQELSGQFNFEVSANGTITSLPETQLYNNNLVTVTLTSGIQASDGSYIDAETEIQFLTITSPSYTSMRKIMMEIGGFLDNTPETTIQTAILEASLEADAMTWKELETNSKVFNHARREYTTCLASTTILQNLGNYLLKSKTLDNFSVTYDTDGIRDQLGKLANCLDRWTDQVMTRGGAKASRDSQYVVKGEKDPDRPIVSRSWQSTETGSMSRRKPAANTRGKYSGSRRWLRTYRKRWW